MFATRSAEPVALRRTLGHGVAALVAFFAVAYGLTALWCAPLLAVGDVVHTGRAWPTHLPSLLGPAIAAVVVTAATDGRAGVRVLLSRATRYRVALRWWAVALSPALVLAVVLPVEALLGMSTPILADFGRFSGMPAGLPGTIALIFVAAMGEELGWRGFALPRLRRRFGPLTSSAVLAPLWFAWHTPFFALLATYRDFGAGQYVGMFLGLACGAVLLTWLFERSGGSVLLTAVWHTVFNITCGTAAATGTTAAVVSTVVMVQGVALIVVLNRDGRRAGLSRSAR